MVCAELIGGPPSTLDGRRPRFGSRTTAARSGRPSAFHLTQHSRPGDPRRRRGVRAHLGGASDRGRCCTQPPGRGDTNPARTRWHGCGRARRRRPRAVRARPSHRPRRRSRVRWGVPDRGRGRCQRSNRGGSRQSITRRRRGSATSSTRRPRGSSPSQPGRCTPSPGQTVTSDAVIQAVERVAGRVDLRTLCPS